MGMYVPADTIEKRVSEITAEIKKLKIERDVLKSITAKAIPIELEDSDGEAPVDGGDTGKIGLTTAIRNVIQERGPTSEPMLVSRVLRQKDRLKTDSNNLMRTVRQTIRNLREQGDIILDGQARLALNPEKIAS